jgi:uncharacterized protein (DUF2141 family)
VISRLTRAVIVVAVIATAGACAVMWPRRQGGGARAPAATSAPATLPADHASGAPLTIKFKDVRNRKGALIFGVFKSADGFPNVESKSAYWEVRDAGADTLTFTTRLPPGRYAASVLHDENRSGEMDRGVAGIPLEGYGVTNNPKPKMRAATFNEATFILPPEGAELMISLQYQFL